MDHRPRAAGAGDLDADCDRLRGRECRVRGKRVPWIAVRVVPARWDRAQLRHRRAGDGTGRGDAARVELPRLHQSERGPSRKVRPCGACSRRRIRRGLSTGSDFGGTTPTYFNLETVHDPSLADDVGFTAEILDRVEADLCIDRSRIFVSGFSNGGAFAATLGCALNDRVAAVASVAGVHLLPDCRGRPMPIIITHGTADDIVLLSEGDVGPAADVIHEYGGNEAQLRMTAAVTGTSVRSWVESWARRNGCRLIDPAVEKVVESGSVRDDGVSEVPSGRRRRAPGDRRG